MIKEKMDKLSKDLMTTDNSINDKMIGNYDILTSLFM
jgi:hypothetical protein